MECEDGKMYVPHDTHIFEILDKNHQRVKPGDVGRLYVTSLKKYSVPLLRYQTTDLAKASPEPSNTRAEFCFQRIEGRISDLISKPDGQILTPRMVDDIISRCENGIGWYSLVQKNENSFKLYLVPTSEYTPNSEKQLSHLLDELLGHDAKISIEPVKELRPGSSGKFRLCYHEKQQSNLQNQF